MKQAQHHNGPHDIGVAYESCGSLVLSPLLVPVFMFSKLSSICLTNKHSIIKLPCRALSMITSHVLSFFSRSLSLSLRSSLWPSCTTSILCGTTRWVGYYHMCHSKSRLLLIQSLPSQLRIIFGLVLICRSHRSLTFPFLVFSVVQAWLEGGSDGTPDDTDDEFSDDDDLSSQPRLMNITGMNSVFSDRDDW